MNSSFGDSRSAALYTAVAITTVSLTTVAYRLFWYREEDTFLMPSWLKMTRGRKGDMIQIKPPLRNVTPLPGEQSRIVYLTGIDKQTGEDELVELFSSGNGRPPIEIDASEISFRKGGGRAWALYEKSEDARYAIASLHSKVVRGCVLCARLEWGVEKDGKRITDKTAHTAIVRGIQRRRGTPKKQLSENFNSNIKSSKGLIPKSKTMENTKSRKGKGRKEIKDPVATYSHNSISLGEIEYPFPSGIYSTKLIQRMSAFMMGSKDDMKNSFRREQDEKLLHLLSDVSIIGCGSVHRYAKEISEAFAMVDALERGTKLAFGQTTRDLEGPIVCYCLGDGKYPVGAAALELFLPKRDDKDWRFIAIDPLLPNEINVKGNHDVLLHDRIESFSGFSQDYSIKDTTSKMSIIIACHSHAPLEEFWERIPAPKLCVAMPCCAQFSELPKEIPILEYDNYEVYSAKRKIKIFVST